MKKILVVGARSTDTHDVGQMAELHAFMHELLPEAEVQTTFFDSIVFTLSPGVFDAYDARSGHDLRDFDQIFIRGPKLPLSHEYAYCLSRFCVWNKIPFFNDYSLYYTASKLAQSTIFLEEDAPFLKTLYSGDQEALLQSAEKTLGYPFILKDSTGSHGDSNYLVKSSDQARQILGNEPDTNFIAQEYCPNDRDYRLLLFADSTLVFERRGSAGSHLNNTSKGGEATLAHGVLPTEIVSQAEAVAKRLKLTIAGVDVMPHLETGAYYFLEINSQPQIRTGALLEEKKYGLRKLFGSES